MGTKDKSPSLSLLEAASSGNLEAVKAQLDSGASLEVLDSIGASTLHLAAGKGHWSITRLLLEKGNVTSDTRR